MPRIVSLIASVLQVDPADLSEEDGTDTVPGWDSLRTLMLASTIEISYGITLDNADFERLVTVKGVREVIARHVGG